MNQRFQGLALVSAWVVFNSLLPTGPQARADGDTDPAPEIRTLVHGPEAISLIKLIASLGLKAFSNSDSDSNYQAASLKCTGGAIVQDRRCSIAVEDEESGGKRSIYLGSHASAPLMEALQKAGAKVKDSQIQLTDFKMALNASASELGVVSFVDQAADSK
jgi:hypothetical protein